MIVMIDDDCHHYQHYALYVISKIDLLPAKRILFLLCGDDDDSSAPTCIVLGYYYYSSFLVLSAGRRSSLWEADGQNEAT